MRRRHLQQRHSLFNYPTTLCVYSWMCKYVSACMCFTVHHTPRPPPPPLHPYPHIRPCLCVPRGILSDRCLLPDAKWITPVWLTVPEGGQPQACLLLWASGGTEGGGCSTEPVPGQKSLTWHSLAEKQATQRHDLWEEISAASGVLALIGCQASHTPRVEMNGCAKLSTLPAWMSAFLSVWAVCLPD